MALQAQAAPPATHGMGPPAAPELISYNPATGAELGRVPICTAAEVTAVVARARAAQPGWAALPLGVRLAHLRRVRAALAEQASALADLTAAEMGKHPMEALAGDVLFALTHLDYAITHARRLLRPRRVRHSLLFATRYAQVVREPRGVIGLISPYNYPILLTANTLFMALAAGNTVVTKPSEHTPLAVSRLAAICYQAGLPREVFQVVTGDHTTGAALIASDIDSLIFVGGTATGQKIATAAAARLLPVTMELGGSNAMVVLADADLEMAAQAAVWGGFVTTGQVCARVGRVLVAAPVADQLLAAIRQATARAQQPAPGSTRAAIGPLTIAASLGQARLAVSEALAEGAQLVTGGVPETYPGSGPVLCPPTVLCGVTPTMRVMREEVFGPIIAVYAVADESEAVRIANSTPYSLTASVWSRDRRRAWALARRIRAGSVVINDHMAPALAAESPWGGMGGASGYGRLGGPYGLLEVTQPKYISYDRLPVRGYPWWYPYTPAGYRAIQALVAALYGRTWRTRLGGLRAMLADLQIFVGRIRWRS
ncbi:MAG TPA: aldehyde dehydrogenase family protein [Chloroflexia bacterium]|nr:aldehyde dehydrogenase family protein [Chloroflexia bacterium]